MDRDLSTGSREVARAAIMIAMTQSREEEQQCRKKLEESEIRSAAADFGGDFLSGMVRIIERAVVAAKREGLIAEEHEEGCVAGAAREALSQISSKALGMSVGGKIGVARCGEHVAVAVFFAIGLVHLNEVCIGMGHRSI